MLDKMAFQDYSTGKVYKATLETKSEDTQNVEQEKNLHSHKLGITSSSVQQAVGVFWPSVYPSLQDIQD